MKYQIYGMLLLSLAPLASNASTVVCAAYCGQLQKAGVSTQRVHEPGDEFYGHQINTQLYGKNVTSTAIITSSAENLQTALSKLSSQCAADGWVMFGRLQDGLPVSAAPLDLCRSESN